MVYCEQAESIRETCSGDPALLYTPIMHGARVSFWVRVVGMGVRAFGYGGSKNSQYLQNLIIVIIYVILFSFAGNVYVIIVFRFLIGFSFSTICMQTSIMITELVGQSGRPIAFGGTMNMINISWMFLAGFFLFYFLLIVS